MRIRELTESKNTPCIVVDVQPAYTGMSPNGSIWDGMEPLMHFLNKQTGPILMFVNAEQQGLTEDTIDEIRYFWEENGFDPDNWDRVTVNDKGYGYLRGWMDNGADSRATIKTIREMYAQKVTDSRELFSGDDSEDWFAEMEEFLGSDFEDYMVGDNISVEWLSLAQLKQFSPGYIMGGGKEECLREVQLMMNAFNIKYKEIGEFIY